MAIGLTDFYDFADHDRGKIAAIRQFVQPRDANGAEWKDREICTGGIKGTVISKSSSYSSGKPDFTLTTVSRFR